METCRWDELDLDGIDRGEDVPNASAMRRAALYGTMTGVVHRAAAAMVVLVVSRYPAFPRNL